MASSAESTVSNTENAPERSKEELAGKLHHLQASATQQYALKNYVAAAEFYSEAAEIQDELNGEMSSENADLLYQYGRCLYHVGVSKSDVLGGRVAQQDEPKQKKRKTTKTEIAGDGEAGDSKVAGDALGGSEERAAEEVVGAAIEDKEGESGDAAAASKPFFQITGDENWTDSEGEEEGNGEGDADEDEDEDDLAIAYEILDTARVLFTRRIDEQGISGSDESQTLRQVKERLADTHDLQAEIKLENEQFADAVSDAKDALSLKLQLYPQESGMIAEAHYKLSIALDFASLPTQSAEAGEGVQVKEEGQLDEEMRKQAAEEMEKAILSCQARIQKDEASLTGLEAGKAESTKRSIADAKDLIRDMKNRLVDLRNPAPAAALTAGDTSGLDGSDPLRGVLGQLLGESKSEQVKRIAEATEQANDLSGLVKHRKKPKVEQGQSEATAGNGKRKAGDVNDQVDSKSSGKKIKFEGDV